MLCIIGLLELLIFIVCREEEEENQSRMKSNNNNNIDLFFLKFKAERTTTWGKGGGWPLIDLNQLIGDEKTYRLHI